MRYEEYVKEQLKKAEQSGIIRSDSMPDMELYLDQTATVFRKTLEGLDGNVADRFAARQYISNYAKRDLIARPEGKKYSREHMIMIAMVIYLRGMLKIDEVRNIMKPLVDNYNSKYDERISIEVLYETAEELGLRSVESVREEVSEAVGQIKRKLESTDLEDDQRMEIFVLILSLAMRADLEKYLVRRLTEVYFAEPSKEKKEKQRRSKNYSEETMSEI